jgi:hypothetical protein
LTRFVQEKLYVSAVNAYRNRSPDGQLVELASDGAKAEPIDR